MAPRVPFERNVTAQNNLSGSAQNNLESAAQNNLCNPGITTSHTGAFVHDDDLQQYATAATRGIEGTKRKQMIFPPPRLVYSKGKIDRVTGKRIRAQSYKKDVTSYLQSWGHRILNDLADDDFGLPAREQLFTLFWDRVRERAHLTDPDPSQSDKATKVKLSYLKAEAMCKRVARDVLHEWDPEYRSKQAARGRLGGRNHRPRGRKATTDEVYLKFVPLQQQGFTRPQLMSELGISKGSVDALRRRYEDDPSIPPDMKRSFFRN